MQSSGSATVCSTNFAIFDFWGQLGPAIWGWVERNNERQNDIQKIEITQTKVSRATTELEYMIDDLQDEINKYAYERQKHIENGRIKTKKHIQHLKNKRIYTERDYDNM